MKHKMSAKFTLVFLLIVALLIVSLASGCAARSEMMVPASIKIAKKIPGSVKVNDIVGGRENNPFLLLTSHLSSSSFTEALTDALVKADLFNSVVKGGESDYLLDVTITSYDQPFIGLGYDVKITTQWELADSRTLKGIWSDKVVTVYKANLGDAFLPAERAQKAGEAAVRANIAEGINRLSKVTF